MEPVIRGLVVYAFLLVIFRISGKRTLADTSSFDLVLLLIISETTQQAMVDNDHSVTNAFLLITTLVGISILLSIVKARAPRVDRWLDGQAVLLVDDGRLLKERLDKMRLDEHDILEAARLHHGLERLDQVKYAILERGGEISVIPRVPKAA